MGHEVSPATGRGPGIETVNTKDVDLESFVDEFTDGISLDVVLGTTGHKSGVEMASDHVRKGGQIVAVGLPGDESELFMTSLVRGEIEFNTYYGSTWTNFEQALRLMECGEIVVDTSLSVDDLEAASTPS